MLSQAISLFIQAPCLFPVFGCSIINIFRSLPPTEMMANEFAELSAVALYFQNLREFLNMKARLFPEKRTG